MPFKAFSRIFFFLFMGQALLAQEVPVQQYSVNAHGRAQLQVSSGADKYYLLRIKHHPDSAFLVTASMTLGQEGTTVLTEALKAYPLDHYQVLEYSVANPQDSDGDGVDDLAEYNAMPLQAPLNAAESITAEHGLLALNTLPAFELISTQRDFVFPAYLSDLQYVKFMIADFDSEMPRVYFINSNNYELHVDFAAYVGVDHLAPNVVKGQIVYHPTVISPNGTPGTYTFNFSNSEGLDFETVQRTNELLAANMPFLDNNLAYFVTANNEDNYADNQVLYENSRVAVLFEANMYAEVDYWGLNKAEGYGFFRQMSPGEVPGLKDIVLYDELPNALPKVGGIITSVMQTPLSHVNLRAFHDHIPNAFIRDPLLIDTIAALLNHYIYFKTELDHYEIREAGLDEVNAWYDSIRPDKEQLPPLNLSYDSILPLKEITFKMFDGFGAKAANVATMRTFGFPEGTIPDGFAVPFYFYQEFMKYNGFFDDIQLLLKDPDFISDRTIRDQKLEELRSAIKTAGMPGWMLDQLSEMQYAFPGGTSIRCRSSTNNEDLPGFSGAGLYDSKTHHPDEGHIAKTIRQVYASLWNLRAFEEREFSRVNHFYASMGVLCHPNFDDEKVNGVGVSADPVYSTDSTFYLNSQLGEELITNPEGAFPEEILVKRYPDGSEDFAVIRYSSLLNGDSLLMKEPQLDLLRQYLAVIHDRFAILYKAENNSTFAMDIEYKIDSTDRLVIKQARPWVAYIPTIADGPVLPGNCDFLPFPNPGTDFIQLGCTNCGITSLIITDMNGKLLWEKRWTNLRIREL